MRGLRSGPGGCRCRFSADVAGAARTGRPCGPVGASDARDRRRAGVRAAPWHPRSRVRHRFEPVVISDAGPARLRTKDPAYADARMAARRSRPGVCSRAFRSRRMSRPAACDLSTLDDPSIFDGPRAGHGVGAAGSRVGRLAARARRAMRRAGAAALFALNYDGRIICTPEDPDDGTIVALVNQHQQTDKGFGPALGPDATDRAAHWFAGSGYRVQRERSDWMLTPASAELQRQLIDGWTQAATEIAPEQARLIDRWRERRLAHLAAGWSHDRRRPRGSGRGADRDRRGVRSAAVSRCRSAGRRAVAVRADLAVEQHVAAHAEHAIARTMAVAERHARRQADRRAAVADQQRRDRDLQPVEQVRFEEHRHRHAAAFDEDAVAAAAAKLAQHLADVDAVGPFVQRRRSRRGRRAFRRRASADFAHTYSVSAESSLNTL